MTELVLPTEKVRATTKSPEFLIIFSPPKCGKTTLFSLLENNLIIDTEKGSNFVDALKIQVNSAKEFKEVCDKIKQDGKRYKYITVDTATVLQDMCMSVALNLYKKTPMGANYTGDILSLPNGAGYKYLRDAFDVMLSEVRGCADRIILSGHTKEKSVEKEGKEVIAKELDLIGKLSSITCSKADAIGYLFREENKCYITFETHNELICGARPPHLRNRKFVISESDQQGNVKAYWDRIFID